MPRYAVSSTTTIINAAVSTVEIVVATTGPISPILDGAPVFIWWSWAGTLASGASPTTTLIRRGTTTGGTLLTANVAQGFTTLVPARVAGVWVDNAGAAAGLQYTLTMTSSGSGVTVTEVTLIAAVL